MTKRIAISELEGAALDWAVAEVIGKKVRVKEVGDRGLFVQSLSSRLLFQPSTEWEHGGPLIERYKPTVYEEPGSGFVAGFYPWAKGAGVITMESEENGGTYLIAACRAIVAAHNPSGYVEVPDELVEGE